MYRPLPLLKMTQAGSTVNHNSPECRFSTHPLCGDKVETFLSPDTERSGVSERVSICLTLG